MEVGLFYVENCLKTAKINKGHIILLKKNFNQYKSVFFVKKSIYKVKIISKNPNKKKEKM